MMIESLFLSLSLYLSLSIYLSIYVSIYLYIYHICKSLCLSFSLSVPLRFYPIINPHEKDYNKSNHNIKINSFLIYCLCDISLQASL